MNSLCLLAGLWVTAAEPLPTLQLPADAQATASPAQALRLIGKLARDEWKPVIETPKGAAFQVYSKVAPAVVVVRLPDGHGTGFLISADGLIVTNHHVVAEAEVDPATGSLQTTVHLGQLKDGRMTLMGDKGLPALVYKLDEQKDLALLKLTKLPDGVKELPFLPIAQQTPGVAADCVAIGHPRAGMLWAARQGVVSGEGNWPQDHIAAVLKRLSVKEDKDRKSLEEFLKMTPKRKVVLSDCAINPGDSGGPLVNDKGEVFCVTFAVPANQPGSDVSLDKLAYHVHLDELKEFLKEVPKEAMVFVPDPWPAGFLSSRLDLDRDGVPDTVAFGQERGGLVTGFLVDLDQDTLPKVTPADVTANKTRGFEFVFQRQPVVRAFYDTDGDGGLDLILTGTDGGRKASAVLRLKGGKWTWEPSKGQDLFDANLFKSDEIKERFLKVQKALKF